MEGAVSVRPATAADADVVETLVRELNLHEGEPTELTTAETLKRDGLGRPDAAFTVLLAAIAGQPVGYVLYHGTYSTEFAEFGFYIYDLYVTEAARGRGAGRALVAAVARAARDEGRGFVWWNSKAANKEAQAMYRRLGAFEEEVRAHALWGEALDRLAAQAQD